MIQDLLRLTQEDASCRRKLHSSFGAEQQFNAEFLFQIQDSLADRGLRHVQAAGGFAVVQMMSDANEVTKMSKLHNRRLSLNLITTSESYDFRDGKNGAIQLADKSETKTDNGSHGEQSSGSRSEAKLSARTYGELQRQLHKDLLAQHPEWIDADGNCPTCDDYERRFARLISIFKSQSKKSQRKERNET
jgi:hypothetical protein